MIRSTATSLTLDAARRHRRRATHRSALAARGRARVDASRAVVDRHAARRRAGLRHQHRLRRARRDRSSRATRSARCSSICCAATPPASASRCRSRAVRATMALRANVLAKGFSGIRLDDARALIDAAQPGVHPVVPSRGSVGASGDLAPLAHLALVLIGEGDATVGDGAVRCRRRRRAARAPASRRSRSTPKEGLALINGTQPSTGDRRRWRCSAPSGWRARPTSPRRCRSTRCAARFIRSSRASTTPRPLRRPGTLGRQPAARCSRAARSTSRTRTAAGCRTPTRCAARRRCTARRATPCASSRGRSTIEANAATDNPMVFADDERDRVGRQLPRRAGGDRRRPAGDRRSRSSRRSASGAPIGWSIRRSASLPAFLTPRQRPAVGLDDGAGDRRGAGLRDQDARASGERRHDPDLGQPGRPREHEHGRRAQGRARASQLATRVVAVEILLRVPGDRSARAARRRRRRSQRVHARVRSIVPTLADDRPPSPDIEAIAR